MDGPCSGKIVGAARLTNRQGHVRMARPQHGRVVVDGHEHSQALVCAVARAGDLPVYTPYLDAAPQPSQAAQ
jgi:hypothetical protein